VSPESLESEISLSWTYLGCPKQQPPECPPTTRQEHLGTQIAAGSCCPAGEGRALEAHLQSAPQPEIMQWINSIICGTKQFVYCKPTHFFYSLIFVNGSIRQNKTSENLSLVIT
jgi:hypothetical protein